MNRFFFSLSILAILVSACGSTSNADIAKSHLGRERHPRISNDNLEAFVSGNNTFALDLYKLLRTKEGNLVISPYSISTAFAMTYAGARGETASQIASTFHFDVPEDQLHSAFNALDLALANHAKVKVPKDKDPIQLNIANAIWAQKDLSFQTPFLDTLGRNYGAGIRLVDFAKNSGAVRQTINSWVDRETKGKIKDIVPEDGFDQDTRLIMVNAIYFEANWQTFFDSTDQSPFHLRDGSRIYVPTLTVFESNAPYARGEDWLAVELPYAGEVFAMTIIVPDAGEFDKFETNVDYPLVSGIIASLEETYASLTLPKFEFTSEFSLAEDLKMLGISEAFSGNGDFSGMTGVRDLCLDDTLHKTYVAVDEEGTTAAAVTEQEFMTISGPLTDPLPIHIDRPFIFIIRDVEAGQILFIGRVLDPTQ